MKMYRKQSTELPLRCIFIGMAVLFIICAVFAVRWVDFRNPVAAVNLFLSVATFLFTLLLYVFCVNSFTWNLRQKNLFAMMILCFYLTNLPLLLTSGIEGTPRLCRLTMLLYTLVYLFSSLYWLSFWFFQRGKFRSIFRACQFLPEILQAESCMDALLQNTAGVPITFYHQHTACSCLPGRYGRCQSGRAGSHDQHVTSFNLHYFFAQCRLRSAASSQRPILSFLSSLPILGS